MKKKKTNIKIAPVSPLSHPPDSFSARLKYKAFILDSFPACISYINGDGYFLYNNRFHEQWFGTKAIDCRGKHVSEVLDQELFLISRPYIEKALAGQEVQFTSVITTPKGKTIDCLVTYSPDFDAQGNCIGFAVLAMDITREQKVARALKKSQEQYQQLFDEMAAALILFEVIETNGSTEPEYRSLKVNKAWKCQTGTSPKSIIGKTLVEAFPHMEENWIEAMDRVYRTGQGEHMEDYFVDLSRFYYVNIFKPQEGLLALSFVDITERKLADQRLMKSKDLLQVQLSRTKKNQNRVQKRLQREINKSSSIEKQIFLSESVFLHTSEGICITDAGGIIEQINPAFTAITGYTAKDAVGQNPRILKSDHHDKDFYRNMWEQLLTKGSWSGEIWNRRKNGESYPEYLVITAVTDEQDRVTHYVALFHDISEIKASSEQILHQSLHDALTGLPNRMLLNDHLSSLLIHADQNTEPLAVAMVDVNNFRDINDSLGYKVGDILLQQIAERISECCRAQDIVARIGGDKFALVLPDINHAIDDALLVTTRIMDQLSKSFSIHGHPVFIHSSIGISTFPEHGHDVHLLLQKAEMALHKAKELGKSRITLFTEDVNEEVQRRINLIRSLRLALKRKEFELYYQPKVRFDNGSISGVEALIRWQTADGELIGPNEFIPLAEKSELILEIGDWVIEEACRQLRIWHEQGHHDFTMAINLSARQFLEPGLVDKLFDALDRNSLKVRHLQLEITEHVMVEYVEQTKTIMERLARYGFSISIDDFGTGFSSLAYLKQFPITTLKIDRSFVMGLPADSHDKTIVRLVQTLAASLGMSVVAEGVETLEQLDFLGQLKCDEFQGYLCSRPLPAEELERFIRANAVWKPGEKE